ncbi:unnamed protein product [Oreochromis niloticus]|nr:unnamed protein product [Mustela putorius furo]
MRPLSEIIEEIDELKVCAVNGETIPFDGWVPIMINLPGGEDPSLSVSTPVLISTLPMDKPLIGFNVLEQITEGQPERLIPTLVTLLRNAICLPPEKAEVVVSFIQTVEPNMTQGRLRTGQRDVIIPAGQVTWVKCRVPSTMNLPDCLVLFEADEGNQALEQLDVLTGLVEIQNPAKPYVTIALSNDTKHDITLTRKTALGTLQPVERIVEAEAPNESRPAVTVRETPEHQRALEQLVDMLVHPPVLAYPDFDQPFVLHTDASEQGLGAVLYQQQGRKLRVIGYGSRTLSPAERNYHLHSGKLEFLALKWAVCEKFRDDLFYAPHFTIYTDNNLLTYIMSTAKLNTVGHRWVGELSDFRFSIKYRPGKTNVDANTLSRVPLDVNNLASVCIEELSQEVVRAAWEGARVAQQKEVAWAAVLLASSQDVMLQPGAALQEVKPDDLMQAQRDDPTMKEVIKLKESNVRLSESIRRGYAEKWRKRMTEAYQVATKNSLSASAKGKSYYDQKVRGVVLKPGDRVLVRNLGERGGPGKLRSYWENRKYVVKEQVSDNPVYVVHPEGNDQGRTRTLHRNLLLLVNDLPVEFPPQPTKLTLRSTHKQTNDRVRGKDREGRIENAETSDSDDDPGSGYWLRVPPTQAEFRTTVPSEKQAVSQDRMELGRQTQARFEESVQSLGDHEEPEQRTPVTDAEDIAENLPEMAGAHKGGRLGREGPMATQAGDEVETHQCDRKGSDSSAALNLPQSGVEPESSRHDCCDEQAADSPSNSPAPLRRSTRQRRPGQMLTYSSLGHPTYQSRPTVNVVDTYLVPSATLWPPQPSLSSFQGPPVVQFPYLSLLYPICSY